MANEEDDYMSDSLLTGAEDVRPGLLFNRSQKRTHEIFKKKVEPSKKPKTHAEKEKELREIGLETPISTQNKGYQLLMKMGFKPGDKIGTTNCENVGLKEPIKIVTKETKTGLGHDTEITEKQKRIVQTRKTLNSTLLDNFRVNAVKKKLDRQIFYDYEKAQRICEVMDSRSSVTSPVCPWYWPKATQKDKNASDDSDSSKEEEAEEEEEEEEEILNIANVSEKLQEILTYLRTTYLYCLYCVIKFRDENDMAQTCPGIFRENHNDD